MLVNSLTLRWVLGAEELSMADLHPTSNPKREAEIDTLGWLFLAVAVVITAAAVMIAYEANDVANAPVSHIAAR